MARRRFFVDAVRNGAAEISGDEARHLARVLRVETGQRYEISDNNQAWLAEVADVRKDWVRFVIIEKIAAVSETSPLVLVAALIKFDRFEWIVEKATELGVSRIVPVESERSETGLLAAAQKRVERWRRIARESSQQSRRDRLPEIDEPRKLRGFEFAGQKFRLEEQGGSLLRDASPDNGPTAVLVGPEGGWTDAERERLDASGWSRASLGPMILRAETAAIAAIALLRQATLEVDRKHEPTIAPPA